MRYIRGRNRAATLEHEDELWRGALWKAQRVSEDTYIYKMIERV
jgi:hypothetical protein